MDHIKHGTTTRFFINPPKILDDLEPFEDGLKEIIPTKLKLLVDRQDFLVQSREGRLKSVDEIINNNPIWEYIRIYQIEADFVEYFVIQKWLRYWLKILQRIDKDFEIQKGEGEITEDEIQKAKEVPIEELYEGRLRGSSRLAGVCPFHEERTPSFTIFTNDNSFYCFGCHSHGDSITFFMKLNKINFADAVKQLNG